MTHKTTIDLNMFGAFVKHIIMRNLNDTPVVTINKRGCMLRCTKVL